ncbi:RidA family protein [Streptomyces sp. NPDC059373]
MPKLVIDTGSALGSYSTAVKAGQHLYVAGTGGFVPGSRQIVAGGIEAEIRQTLENLKSTVATAGYELLDVVSVTCYLRNPGDWPLFDRIFAEYFPKEAPARAAVSVGDMPGNSQIEITAVAWRDGA